MRLRYKAIARERWRELGKVEEYLLAQVEADVGKVRELGGDWPVWSLLQRLLKEVEKDLPEGVLALERSRETESIEARLGADPE